MKHAQAQQVDVEVIFAPSGLVMRIKDNGKGFAPDQKLKNALWASKYAGTGP